MDSRCNHKDHICFGLDLRDTYLRCKIAFRQHFHWDFGTKRYHSWVLRIKKRLISVILHLPKNVLSGRKATQVTRSKASFLTLVIVKIQTRTRGFWPMKHTERDLGGVLAKAASTCGSIFFFFLFRSEDGGNLSQTRLF